MFPKKPDPLVITCAITGAETSQEDQPALPVTPREQGEAAAEAFAAGARVIHLHVREDDGRPSQRVERFSEAIASIRERAPEAIIQLSTGGAVGEAIERRMEPLLLRPEMASLNLGTMNFGEEIFENRPADIRALATRMTELGIAPELEVYEAGMLEAAFALHEKGVLAGPLRFQFVLGVPGGMSGDLRNLLHLLALLKDWGRPFRWGVAGVGRFQLPLAAQAILLGGDARVGFEDNIYYSRGVPAKSNAELVARVARVASDLGRSLASPAQARAALGIPDPGN